MNTIQPAVFRLMTPRQRRDLAARRRREVEAARSAPSTPVQELVALIASAMPPLVCEDCGAPAGPSGLCRPCQWRDRALERRARHLVDEVAVRRLASGDRSVEGTREEQLEALRLCVARGLSDEQIGQRFGVCSRTVLRWRKTHGIESGWVA